MPRSSSRGLVASLCAFIALALALPMTVAPSGARAAGSPAFAEASPASLATGALPALGAQAAPAAAAPALDGTRSPRALLAQDDTEVVVALFSLPGCPYCEVVRRNYLRHLEGEVRGLRVAEYGIDDERSFAGAAPGREESKDPASPAALAKSLRIRVAPTVVFLGDGGRELAERLVGFNSPDFYGAYLDGGIARALSRARESRK